MRHIKYLTEEQKQAAHAEAQRRHIEKKKSGIPTRKKTDPKMISTGDAPFTLTDWKRSE
jgi:hypothetical protein